jgi:hypothetical protein
LVELEADKQKKKLNRKVDLALLIVMVTVSLSVAFGGGSVYAQYGNQAEGSDVVFYVETGFAFQCLPRTTNFLALYMTEGALNSTTNSFFIGPAGGGTFTFVSLENASFRILKSVAANIQGDQGKSPRAVSAGADGLSTETYVAEPGNRVTIHWAPSTDWPFALPLITFWGFVGGSMVTAAGLGGTIKKRSLSLMWLTIIAAIFSLVCFIIWVNI